MNDPSAAGLDAHTLKAGFDNFETPRQPDDIDMVVLVRHALVAAGLEQNVIAAYDNDPLIREASQKRPAIQCHLLNRFWVQQFVALPVDTMDARASLQLGGSPEVWCRSFNEHSMPYIVEHQLPKPL